MTVALKSERTTAGSAAGIDYLRRCGADAGPTMVLLHGIGSSSESFAPLMSALPETLDRIAWAAPGYGGSRALASAHPNPRDYAGALLRLLDALKLSRRIVLLGHSLGCLFAASFAAAYPDRVSALILVSPALGYRTGRGAALPPTLQNRIEELKTLGPKAFAAQRAVRLVHDPARHRQVAAAVERAMAAVRPEGYVQAVYALGAGDLLTDASQVEAPALVAVGAEDAITPPDRARAACAALPRAAGCYVIPAGGHALPQEQPGRLAAILARFIEEHVHA